MQTIPAQKELKMPFKFVNLTLYINDSGKINTASIKIQIDCLSSVNVHCQGFLHRMNHIKRINFKNDVLINKLKQKKIKVQSFSHAKINFINFF